MSLGTINKPAGTEPHPVDPLAALRARTQNISIFGSAAVLLCGIWAGWPLGSTQVDIPSEPSPPSPLAAIPKNQPLDLAAFSAPTWEAPPLPPKPVAVAAAPPPPPPPPPLKLQLLGIVRDDATAESGAPIYVAAIYDEVSDTLLMLRSGDAIGTGAGAASGRISRVHADSVELTDASGPRRLALHQPIAPIPGLSGPYPTVERGGRP